MNTWVNNCVAGDLRRHGAHHDVIVIKTLHGLCGVLRHKEIRGVFNGDMQPNQQIVTYTRSIQPANYFYMF